MTMIFDFEEPGFAYCEPEDMDFEEPDFDYGEPEDVEPDEPDHEYYDFDGDTAVREMDYDNFDWDDYNEDDVSLAEEMLTRNEEDDLTRELDEEDCDDEFDEYIQFGGL